VIDITKIARPCILNRKDYVPGKPVEEVQREFGIKDIIKLASNENPLGASPLAVKAMVRELQTNANFYPESLAPSLTAKLAKKFNLTSDHFYIDNGADGILSKLGMAFINPGDDCIISALTFPVYESIIGLMTGNCVVIPQTADYRSNVDGMIKAITPKTKLVFLCNPNNPTGTITTRDEFDRLIKAIPENTLLISDEAYYEFADDPDYPQSLEYLEKYPNLIVLRTFSKVYGLAGVRVGYAIAHPDLIRALLKTRETFAVNRAAQAGALAAMDDEEFIVKARQANAAGRKQIYDGLFSMGFKAYPAQGNFVFSDLGHPVAPIFNGLLREGVIIRPLGPQGAPNCIRVSVGTAEQNERFLKALQKVFTEVYPAA